MKKALISGITGQDGSYLTELLLDKDYEVHGIIRRASVFNTERIDHLIGSDVYNKRLFLHHGDMVDSSNLNNLVSKIQPDETYNLAAQSHVKVSFDVPEYTANVDGVGVLRFLDAIHKFCPKSKFYQASTSEMYGGIPGDMPKTGYTEESPFYPRSPYGAAKVYGYWITKNYREAYGMFASNGVLFNHESARRGKTFVTRKITQWCAKYYLGRENGPLRLGNIYASRDWGHANDYCEAMIAMLQYDKPDDFVISTGETHTVKEFVEACFAWMGEKIEWEGQGISEKGFCGGSLVLEIDEKYFRPSEVETLLGDNTKAKKILGWEPKFTFDSLVEDMMENEINQFKK